MPLVRKAVVQSCPRSEMDFGFQALWLDRPEDCNLTPLKIRMWRSMWLWGSTTWTSMLRKVGTDFVFVLAKSNRTKRVPKFLRMKLSCLWSLNTLRKSGRSRCMTKYSDIGRHIYTYYTSSQPLFCWRTDSCRKSESIATVANLEDYSRWT